jgi:CheY-like chemotaxis protein
MYVLFIDDADERHNLVEKILGKEHAVLHAFTYDEAIDILGAQIQIGLVMFDRDLGDFIEEDGRKIERTGHTIIRYMRDNISHEKWPPMAVVHSYNSEAQYMAEDLAKMGISTRQIQFSGDLVKQLAQELTAQ